MSSPERSDVGSVANFSEASENERPEQRHEDGGKWDHVLVDEYQDTYRLQAMILTE